MTLPGPPRSPHSLGPPARRTSAAIHSHRWRGALVLAGIALCAPCGAWASASPGTEPAAAVRAALEPVQSGPQARPRRIDPELGRRMQTRVETALAAAEREGAGRAPRARLEVGYAAVDLTTGVLIAERHGDRAFAPASNMKLATSLAALALLPADWSFTTPIEASGPLEGGVLRGDLIVRASGDPFYDHSDPGAGRARLDLLAGALRARGLARIDGRVLLDSGAWPDPGPAPGWPQPQGSWTASYALVSGFTLNGGQLSARIRTAQPGRRAAVDVRPGPSGLEERDDVLTTDDAAHDVRIGVVDARRSLSITGRLGARYGSFERAFRHPHPPLQFEAALMAALAGAGIEVRGGVQHVRGTPRGTELGRLESPWLDLLVPINTHSVNAVSDALFLALGNAHGGTPTRAAAEAAVRAALVSLGVPTAGFVQVDGSGLSRDNRATARQLVELLAAGMELGGERRAVLLDSLAVAGESGTLAGRMGRGPTAGRVRAKTGFLRGASALTGVVSGPDGGERVFAILVEYPPLDGFNDRVWKPMQDDLVAMLAAWNGGVSSGPAGAPRGAGR